VLGSIFQSAGKVIPECVAKIQPEAFYVPAHRTLYIELCDVWESGEPIHLITFTQRLRDRNILDAIGGAADLTKIAIDFVPTAALVGYYLDIVLDKYILREAIATCTEMVRRAYEPLNDDVGEPQKLLDEVESRIASIRSLGRNGADEGKPLIDYAELNPAEIEAANLLGKRWLCRKGIALLNGATGVGKSSASVQAMILWTLGREAFGIKPAGPLKFLYIQAENDDGDMCELTSGVCDHFRLGKEEREIIRRNVIVISERSLSGEQFLAQLRRLIRRYKPDIVWIDPLQAYAGGDLKDSSVTTAFLRNGVNALLDEADCAAIVSHHSTKTIYSDTASWTLTDWNYFGAGGAEIANVPRAILNIEHTTAPGVFKWHAGKRWDRIGWADENGNPTSEHVYCWHNLGAIYWRDSDDTDLLRIESTERKAKGGKTEDDLFNIIPPDNSSILKKELLARGQKAGIGYNNGDGMLKVLIGDKRAFEWQIPRPRNRPEIWISRIPQPQPELGT
jgi:hypothetical protein